MLQMKGAFTCVFISCTSKKLSGREGVEWGRLRRPWWEQGPRAWATQAPPLPSAPLPPLRDSRRLNPLHTGIQKKPTPTRHAPNFPSCTKPSASHSAKTSAYAPGTSYRLGTRAGLSGCGRSCRWRRGDHTLYSSSYIDDNSLWMLTFLRHRFTFSDERLDIETNSIFSHCDSLFDGFSLCYTSRKSSHSNRIASLFRVRM